jgi:hypothetical protein
MNLEEENKSMKHMLSFLPEFKQEIEALIMLPQNIKPASSSRYDESYVSLSELTRNQKIFSRLQNILSHLEKFPSAQDILEETDYARVMSLFGEFQQIKLNAQVLILTIRTNLKSGMDYWGGQIGKQKKYLWAVNIFPLAYIPARMVVISEDSGYRIVFGICLSEERVSTSILRLDLPPDWTDPLEKPLRQLDLLQSTKQLSMDGIEYELFTDSWTSHNTIWFGNPYTTPFIEMEKGLFDIAEIVVNEIGTDVEKVYLSEWQKYLEK